MLTLQHLKKALKNAANCSFTMTTEGLFHHAQSAKWVECLAEELRSICKGDSVTVFTKHDDRNRKHFGLNELLYDISICETKPLPSKDIHYITRALWQVESELAEGNLRNWVKDFNKLVIGSAENKLFIGPTMRESSRDALLPIAKCCSNNGYNIYIATIPHPKDWTKDRNFHDMNVSLWKLSGGEWVG